VLALGLQLFFSVDQVIKLNLEGCERVNYNFEADFSQNNLSRNLSQDLLMIDNVNQLTFSEIFSFEKGNKNFDDKHLPKIAQDYLEKVKLFDFPFTLISIGNNYKNQGNSLLYLIEIFCETLKVVPPKLFNIAAVEFTSSNSQSPKFYRNKLTRLGYIWFSF
jgi:hypothetical protein